MNITTMGPKRVGWLRRFLSALMLALAGPAI